MLQGKQRETWKRPEKCISINKARNYVNSIIFFCRNGTNIIFVWSPQISACTPTEINDEINNNDNKIIIIINIITVICTYSVQLLTSELRFDLKIKWKLTSLCTSWSISNTNMIEVDIGGNYIWNESYIELQIWNRAKLWSSQ